MKKHILIGILLLSVCTSQAMNQKIEDEVEEVEEVEVQSLLEKYIPSARTAKKILFFGALLLIIDGVQAFDFKAPTLQECSSQLSEIK